MSFYLPRQFCHCHMGCCQVLCCALSVLPQGYFHVLHVASRVTKLENFVAKTLAFLWYVLFENHPRFEGNNNFINSQIFGRVVKFGKMSCIFHSPSKFLSVLSGLFLLSVKCE